MTWAGFVLVGGASSRMGQDKALLPFRGTPLLQHVAAIVAAAAGSVTLVGDPQKYAAFGYPVIPDPVAGAGPLAGICAALSAGLADWNLIVACDMPAISAAFLRELLGAAETSAALCLLPAGPAGIEPLCAAYHRAALPDLRQALDQGIRKLRDALSHIPVETRQLSVGQYFTNCNTPQDWSAFLAAGSPVE
jgi:molybdopterin-guanine dinucleotide biosynthesis protein A